MKISCKKIKYILIITLSSILAMVLHGIASGSSTVPKEANWSVFVKTVGLLPVITLYFFAAFAIITYLFHRYEDRLPGIKSGKGIRYGFAIGLLWLWGMLEGVSLSGNPFVSEFITGICDAVPIVFMGLLLGKFTTESNDNKDMKKPSGPSHIVFSITVFSVVFLLGRYSFYYTKVIKSGYESSPYFTFIWTLLMGACIGVAYLLLGQTTQSSSLFLSAIKFGVILFGVNWCIFTVLIPLIFAGTVFDSVIRMLLDTFLVILSYYLSEALEKRKGSINFFLML